MKVKFYDAVTNHFKNGKLKYMSNHYYVEEIDEEVSNGVYLSPGWIDIHAHTMDGVGLFGMNGDKIGYQMGVCLNVDAGTSGDFTYRNFRDYVIPKTKTNTKAFINISPIGAIFHHEYNVMEYLDPDRTVETIKANPDLYIGVKVRMGSETIRHEGVEPIRLASQAAREAGVPMMAHIGGVPPTLLEMEEFFEAGDVITHAFNGRGEGVWNSDGTPSEVMQRLIDKGVILDVGHGGSSFEFNIFERAYQKGLPPFLVSSDLHSSSVNKILYSFPSLLSRLYGSGMTLEELMYGVTKGPASVLGLDYWCDLQMMENATLFRVVDKTVDYEDCEGNHRIYDKAIEPLAVILNGEYILLHE